MISALFLLWVHVQLTLATSFIIHFLWCVADAVTTATNARVLMSTMGPTTLSPRRSGRRSSALARTGATEQGSNKVAAAVADSAGGLIPSDSPAADVSTLPSPPVAFRAMGNKDGITGSADTPGGADLFIDESRTPGVSGAAAISQAAAALGAPHPSIFPAQRPLRSARFTNFDEGKFDKGYDSGGGQLHYDPVALEEDWEDFVKEAIGETPVVAPAVAPIQSVRRDKNTTINYAKKNIQQSTTVQSGSVPRVK